MKYIYQAQYYLPNFDRAIAQLPDITATDLLAAAQIANAQLPRNAKLTQISMVAKVRD